MLKKIIVISILLIFISIGFVGELKFNDIPLIKVEQDKYPNSNIYSDEAKKMMIYELKLMQVSNGMLVPENGTILSDYIILPIEKKKVMRFTEQDYNDIITFINNIDLKNRMYKE